MSMIVNRFSALVTSNGLFSADPALQRLKIRSEIDEKRM
jgi:hypothetical protein